MTLGHAMGAGARGRRLREGGRVTPKKAKPKVCLVMIVRDEAAIIEERLLALRGEIDGAFIVDTGSTDDTKARAEKALLALEIVWAMADHPWAGFADARTYAVDQAESFVSHEWPTDERWALLLDADTIFHRLPTWRSALSEGVNWIGCEVHHGSIRYSHPRLLKLGAHEWRWRGVLHEYLVIPFGAHGADTSLLWVEHGSGGARSKNPQKFLLDAETLRAARESGVEPDLAARYTFYEAQSWRDGGRPHAAEEAYLARTSMGGFGQEVYLAWLNVGELRLADGELAGALEAWTKAWGVDPSRAEALVGIASILRTWECWWPAYTFGRMAQEAAPGSRGMFADQTVRWKADFEIGVSAWYVGKLGEGRAACEAVLAADGVPEAVLERTGSNLSLYLTAISQL